MRIRFRNFFNLLNNSKGLTLIEVIVTSSLIVFISSLVIRNIAISKLNLERLANVVASDVRLAQSLALSTRITEGEIRCGYGLTQIDSTTYLVYAGPPTTKNCASRFYQDSLDHDTYKTVILDPRAEFENSPAFKDIYYEPPDPKVYLQGPSTVEKITIRKAGMTAPQQNFCRTNLSPNCIYVCAYLSGRVEITRGPSCP